MAPHPSLLGAWSFEPPQLVPVIVIGLAYAVRARRLGRRGARVPVRRVVLFAGGIALVVIAVASPIATLGEEEFLSFHMAQHLLLLDLAPLALLAGLSGPLVRPVLALPGVARLRVLAHPLVGLPLWLVVLALWHVPRLYEAALSHQALHALEHLTFFAAGLAMWLPVLETLPAPAWFGSGSKLAYVLVVRLAGATLANVFLWWNTVLYPTYARAGERWGITPLGDQRIAGGLMLLEGSILTLAIIVWLFLRAFGEAGQRQELLERGLPVAAVHRAVRFGRGEKLSDLH